MQNKVSFYFYARITIRVWMRLKITFCKTGY